MFTDAVQRDELFFRRRVYHLPPACGNSVGGFVRDGINTEAALFLFAALRHCSFSASTACTTLPVAKAFAACDSTSEGLYQPIR